MSKFIKIIWIVLAIICVYIIKDVYSHKCTNATTIQCANCKLVTASQEAAETCSNVVDGNDTLRNDSASSSNKVTVFTVNNDGIVKTTAHDKFITGSGSGYTIAWTNTVLIDKVMWREIRRQWYEQCACPDGIRGCAVIHSRLMEEAKLEPISLVADKEKGD